MTKSLDHIEWEMLQEPLLFESLIHSSSLKPAPDRTEVQRGRDYQIEIKMSRESATYRESEFERKLKKGEVIKGEDIIVAPAPGKKIFLHSVVQNGNAKRGRADENVQVDLTVSCHRISEVFDAGLAKTHVLQYMIGCPDAFLWPRGTTRDENVEFTLRREGLTENSDQKYNFSIPTTGISSTSDHILLKTRYGEVLFSQSPAEAANGFSPCYFHFCEEPRAIEKDYRDSWIEALSFVLGKRLLPVGHSFFEKSGIPIERHAYTPYATNLRREVNQPLLPPTDISADGYSIYSEEKISELVDLYLEKREELKLNEVLWNFWTAREMPLGKNFVCYSAALEGLIEAWFESTKEDRDTKYVSSDDYKAAIMVPVKDELDRRSLADTNWAAVRGRMHIPNDLSLAEKKRRFFKALELDAGKVEDEVMAARNKYAHGSAYSDDDPAKLLALKRAFEALVNRCILKCLGYSDSYFDYSAYDFPLAPLQKELTGR